MYQKKLSAEEWKSAAVEFIQIINRQYRIFSPNQISSVWEDCSGAPRVTLEFPNRDFRLAFEALWGNAMQGVCSVTGNSSLVLDYL